MDVPDSGISDVDEVVTAIQLVDVRSNRYPRVYPSTFTTFRSGFPSRLTDACETVLFDTARDRPRRDLEVFRDDTC